MTAIIHAEDCSFHAQGYPWECDCQPDKARDEAVALLADALIRKAGSPAKARSLLEMMNTNPELSVDECLAEFERAQKEDVR